MNIRLVITSVLTAVMIAVAPLTLHADMVGTTQLLTQQERNGQIELVESFMAREEVRNQMESLGVDPLLASERVAGMTDSQLQQLAANIQDMPAGSGALGLVVVVLVIIILLEILGITNISGKI